METRTRKLTTPWIGDTLCTSNIIFRNKEEYDEVDNGCLDNCSSNNYIYVDFKISGNSVVPNFYPVDIEGKRLTAEDELTEYSLALNFVETYDERGRLITPETIEDKLRFTYHGELSHSQIQGILWSILLYNHIMVKLSRGRAVVSIVEDWDEIKTIGLMGPGYGCTTKFMEKICSLSVQLKKHAIYHDIFGPVYRNSRMTNGYCYGIKKTINKNWIKESPLFGHISGIYKILKKDYFIRL